MSDSPFRAAPSQVMDSPLRAVVRDEVPQVPPADLAAFEAGDRWDPAVGAAPDTAPINGDRSAELMNPVSPHTDAPPVRPGGELLLRPRRPVPQSGFRRVVHLLTGGAINPGLSSAQLRSQDRHNRLLRPLHGVHVVTYLCLKGGISKTSTAVGVAGCMAAERPDSAILADFNPDAGDAAERVTGRKKLAGVTRLAQAVDQVTSVGMLAEFLVSQGRLTVLPGEPNPALGESLSSDQFAAIMDVLCRYFSTIHLDAGTGITHPIMPGILSRTNTVVVPAAFSITGAERAAETIEWLRDNGFANLADTAIVALTEKDAVSCDVDKDAVRRLYPQTVAVVEVPQDPHIADGAMVRRELMRPATLIAYEEIGALICDRFQR